MITVVVAQLSCRGWVSGGSRMLRGEGLLRPLLIRPRACAARRDVRTRIWRTIPALSPETEWSPDRLRSLLRTQLRR